MFIRLPTRQIISHANAASRKCPNLKSETPAPHTAVGDGADVKPADCPYGINSSPSVSHPSHRLNSSPSASHPSHRLNNSSPSASHSSHRLNNNNSPSVSHPSHRLNNNNSPSVSHPSHRLNNNNSPSVSRPSHRLNNNSPDIEAADQTFYLTQSKYTDTGPTSPSADPITPGFWQGSHWSARF